MRMIERIFWGTMSAFCLLCAIGNGWYEVLHAIATGHTFKSSWIHEFYWPNVVAIAGWVGAAALCWIAGSMNRDKGGTR